MQTHSIYQGILKTILLCLVALALPPQAQAADAQPAPPAVEQNFAPGQVLVQFKPDATALQRQEALAAAQVRSYKHIHTAAMQRQGHPGLFLATTDLPVLQAVAALIQHPAVAFAEPNWLYRHQAVSNDPYFTGGQLWGLYGDTTSPSNRFGVHASKAWAQGFTGASSVYVGVIDEGIQWQHPDLAANIWTNPFEVPNDGLDNDRNGYVDDVHGWNFYSGNNSIYSSSGDSHGTHVAGTIGAQGGNARGVVGVNWRVTVLSGKFLGPNGGAASDAIEAIDYFTDLKLRHGLNIVALNNSWGGGGYSQALHDAILRAAKADILFAAAAGNGATLLGLTGNNDSIPQYPSNYDTSRGTSTESPASYNSVIAVAAIDKNGALASFSNFGSRTVHLGAPGVGIYSTLPTDSYGALSGTSMATPHCTGAIALYASTHPNASAAQIRNALLTAVTPTSSLQGKTTTGGRLNLATVILPVGLGQGVPAMLKSPRVIGNSFRLTLEGGIDGVYEIQASTDLANWTRVATVTNTIGTVEFSDPISPGRPRRFYRALAQ